MKTFLWRPLATVLIGLALFATAAIAALPQSVTITTPANNSTASVSTPTPTISISATAVASSGGASISSIEYRVNGTTIGTLVGSTSTIQWQPPAIGTYILTAIASDSSASSNNTLTSSPVTVTISSVRLANIVAPATNTSVPQNSRIFLRSTASMSDGVVSQVDFLLNGTVVATATSSPFNAAVTISNAPGTYPLVARATASDGVTTFSSAANNLIVATPIGTPPTVSVTSPAANAIVGLNQAVNVTATAAATNAGGFIPTTTGGGVTFYVDGDPVGTDLTAPYSVSWTPTAIKSYSLNAQATDDKGNTWISAPITVTAPAANASIAQGTATTIQASATASNGATVSSVEFFANGVSLGTDVTAPYSFSWTPPSTGAVALTARVTDSAGAIVTSSPVNVTVTAAVPTVAISAPTNGASAALGAGSVTLAATATAPGTATVNRVDFIIGGTVIGTALVPDSSGPFVGLYTTSWTPAAAGITALTAKVTDSNGANATSSIVNVTVTAPTVSLTAPASGASLPAAVPVTLTANAAAVAPATVSKVDFLVGGVVVGTATAAPYSTAWAPSTTGTTILNARVTDSNGAVVTSANVSITVTAAPLPIVTITSPAANASVTVGSTTTLIATASATAPATVAKVEFLAGTTLVGTALFAPYQVPWTPTTTSTGVSLTARVTDTNGSAVISQPVSVAVVAATVTPASAAITSPANGTVIPLGTTVPVTATATAAGTATVTRVDFLAGTTIVGTVLTPPYAINWTPTTAGIVPLAVRLTDSSGAQFTSSAVNVSVATLGVSLLTPTSGTNVTAFSPVLVTANPTVVAPATVAKVDFYAGTALIGSASAPPYVVTWIPQNVGASVLTAKVTDSTGASANSTAVNVNVTAASAPTVAVTSPSPGTVLSVGNDVSVVAAATPGAGAAINQVQFFAGATSLGIVNTPPYAITWIPKTADIGTVSLSAQVIDSNGTTVKSTVVPVTVAAAPVDDSPTVSLSLSPSSATTLPQGAVRYVLVTATAGAGRAIERVEFFLNGAKVAEKTSAPYTYQYVAGASSGTATLVARATDNGGLFKETQVKFTLVEPVGVPPTIILLAPSANALVLPGAPVNLVAAAQSSGGTIASVQFYARGEPQGTARTASPYTGTFTPTIPGNYLIEAVATDDRGNTTVSNSVTITAAFATPTVAIISPNIATTARATPNVPLTVTATAQGGNGSGILLVELLVDGTPVVSRTSPSLGTSYTFQWTPTLAQLGGHVITTRATDVNSQTTLSAALNVNVASIVGTPPTVTISSPTAAAAGNIQSLSVVNLVANAFATGSGNAISTVEFFLNDTSIGLGVREQNTNLYRLPYNFGGYDFSALTPDASGRYTLALYAIAKDSNGNQTISTTTNLGISPSTSAPPAVQLNALGTNPSVSQGTAFPMVATASDPDGNVISLQLFVNGVSSGAAIANPGPQTVVSYTPTTAGRFNLYVVATDDTGNTAVSAPPIALTVNAITAPTTTITRPSDDSTVTSVGAPVFLEATATTSDPTQTPTVSFVATGTNGGRTTVGGTRVGTTTTYRATWTPATADTFSVVSQATVGTVSGNSTTARRVVVTTVVGIAPVVSISTPNSTTTVSTVNLTATASDSDGSVIGVEFFINRNSIGQAVRDQLTNTWRITASFANVPVGATEVVALARDSAGNVAASAINTVTVNAATGAAPTLTIFPSTTNVAFNRQLQLTADARDTDGSISSVQYFANAASVGSSGNAPSYQVNWTPTQPGTFNVWAVTTDSNGNTTVAPTVQVTVRRNDPVLDDSAFILQAYRDVANTSSINPLVLADLDAQLAAGTITRAQLVASLTAEPGFTAPTNLLAAYYVVMGQWPTPTNYLALLSTARNSLPNAIGAIISSNEYTAKYGATTNATTFNAGVAGYAALTTFATRLWQNAGLPPPGALEIVQFRNNDTLLPNLGRGYTVTDLNTAVAEFITNTNSGNAALHRNAQAAALFYQIDRPQVSMSTSDITARVAALAQAADLTAMANVALKDILFINRFVTILQEPVSLTVAPKSGAIFSVTAEGAQPLSYQWQFNGATLPGATGATLYLTNVDATRVGTYTVAITSPIASATSDPASLALSSTPTRLANISTRGMTTVTPAGDRLLIAGFVVTGAATQTRQMLVRVAGPTLTAAPFNVSGALADPRLEIYNAAGVKILENDNWGAQTTGGATAVTAVQQATTRVGAFALPANSTDAAVLATLPPGAYTVQAKGPNNSSGVVLVEVYDATPGTTAGPKAINVSTRGPVGTGNNVLIAGFVVNGAVSRRVLIRGIGPTLSKFGVNGVLADPQITLVDQTTGTTLQTNDNWDAGDSADAIAAAARAGGAFPLAAGSKDASILTMLPPGAYTVQLSGVGNTTGIGIVEVYDVDP
jgi:hypothetical protein